MPESPEIASQVYWINKFVHDKEFYGIKNCGKYIFDPDEFTSSFRKPMQYIKSKGKVIFMQFHNIGVAIHHKMGGYFTLTKDKYCQVVFYFRGIGESKKTGMNITKLYLSNSRFGNFDICDSKIIQEKIDALKPDFIGDFRIDLSTWRRNIKQASKKRGIYDLLLSQKDICSGLGNYLCANILYRAKLHPKETLDKLTIDDIEQLYSICETTVKEYYDNHIIEIDKYIVAHPDFKINENGLSLDYATKHHDVYMQKTDPLGNQIKTLKLAGRTCHYSPTIQKLRK